MKTGNPQIDDSTADWIVGSDEAGYGAWAGHLSVAAAAVPRGWVDTRVQDSKAFSGNREAQERARAKVFKAFIEDPRGTYWVCKLAEAGEIDRVGVWQTLHQLHEAAQAEVCKMLGGTILQVIDGNLQIPGAIALPKADALVPAVSLASIVAKASRDALMVNLAQQYPGYGFERNKGYGTAKHVEGLDRLGPCPIHRTSYGPIAKRVESMEPQEAWFLDED